MMQLTEQLRADLETLQAARTFFAHQSVGSNILDGLTVLAREGGVSLHINPPDQFGEAPGIAQGIAGRNGDPDSKIRYFSDRMASFATVPRVALMKFCYVDFTPSTNGDAVFQNYERAMRSLQHMYPSVTFVHVTVPLTTRPSSFKDSVKRLMGRPVRKDEANARRATFNQRLRAAFEDQLVFDLARVESTRPDGTPENFRSSDGITAAALFRGYTSDGGHLNELGRRLAAAEFARVVAAATRTN
ncbi:MAG TPA: hypothetical protein VH702_09480 [Vicinamibacterales bacterium]|jgi:hypothetical protein